MEATVEEDLSLLVRSSTMITTLYTRIIGKRMPITERVFWAHQEEQPLKGTNIVYAFHPRENVIWASELMRLLGVKRPVMLLHSYSMRNIDKPLIKDASQYMDVVIPQSETYDDYSDSVRAILRKLEDADKIVVLDHHGTVTRIANNDFGYLAQRIRSIFITTSAKKVVESTNPHGIPIIPAYDSYFKKNENRLTAHSIMATCKACGIKFKNLYVGIIGTGTVGLSLALLIRSEGAIVVVCELDPVKQLDANERNGFPLSTVDEIVRHCDLILTATGVDPGLPEGRTNRAIRAKHFPLFRRDKPVTIINCGSYLEIDREALDNLVDRRLAVTTPIMSSGKKIGTAYKLCNGVEIHLIADGLPANLGLGGGNPVQTMDRVQAMLLELVCYIQRSWNRLNHGLNTFPYVVDQKVAKLVMEAKRYGK